MFVNCLLLLTLIVSGSVADPDPKNRHHFAGSIIFSMEPELDPNPDSDQNLAHFHHLSPPPSHFIFHPCPHPNSFTLPPSPLNFLTNNSSVFSHPSILLTHFSFLITHLFSLTSHPHTTSLLPHPSPLLRNLTSLTSLTSLTPPHLSLISTP